MSAVDYTDLQDVASTLINDLGLPLTFTRLGTKLGTVIGVSVANETSSVDEEGADMSQITSDQLTFFIPGNMKWTPLPGDDVSYKGAVKQFQRVVSVHRVNPNIVTTVYYKVVMT